MVTAWLTTCYALRSCIPAMKPLSIRLTPRQIAWLDSHRAEGEARSGLVRRLLGSLMADDMRQGEGASK